MILALKLWLVWHALIALVALVERLPHWVWQKLPRGSGLKIKLAGRVWVNLVAADGWVGYFWDGDRRRLYVSLFPFVVTRFDFARRTRDHSALYNLLFGEMRMEKRARAMTNAQLSASLCNEVWGKFAMGTWPSVIAGEAMDRLRSMPSPRSGAARIARERLRQIQEEDFTAERDDAYVDGQLTDAAACFILAGDGLQFKGWDREIAREEMLAFCWPFPAEWCKPKHTPAENYVVAGSLLAAEADRLDRSLEARMRAELKRKAAS